MCAVLADCQLLMEPPLRKQHDCGGGGGGGVSAAVSAWLGGINKLLAAHSVSHALASGWGGGSAGVCVWGGGT
eukprot:269267-Chlamydomonas_euryale.AAC.1